MSHKYAVFDQTAVNMLVSNRLFQSVEYVDGLKLVQHVCKELSSEIIYDINIYYSDDGVIFCGKKGNGADLDADDNDTKHKIFCIDLTTCQLLSERSKPNELLTVLQKAFRTCIKIWKKLPFSFSERIHGSKSIVFPFVMTDPRRIVIERSNVIPRLEKRNIISPLLAYKYNSEDAPRGEEVADTTILKRAGECYAEKYYELQLAFKHNEEQKQRDDEKPYEQIVTSTTVERSDFIYWDFKQQLENLTSTQREIVDTEEINLPIRIEGAAGTGKTVSLVMRAYRLLERYRDKSEPIKIIFLSHSDSTCKRNRKMFNNYPNSSFYLEEDSPQYIQFNTLLRFCCGFANISESLLLEQDADDAKLYQIYLIEEVLESCTKDNLIQTYRPFLSSKMKDLFDTKKTPISSLCAMLQHEFSVQIKGRTDCTFDKYNQLPSIANGIPCTNEKDKEFVFHLFKCYQERLKEIGTFDVDDVVIEALSKLSAPFWRRDRKNQGYDYIIVDEMHLFNINEQSVFHLLTTDPEQTKVPICFAMDYCQAIGDRGDTKLDYIEQAFGKDIRKKNYQTVFRNSPQIADFCAAIASSGTLMFQETFSNPYEGTQHIFTDSEEKKCEVPKLYMYKNDDEMYRSIQQHADDIKKKLHCKFNEIALIFFNNNFIEEEEKKKIKKYLKHNVSTLKDDRADTDALVISTPYEINGMEFEAVILVGVDEGRVPQTSGTADVSQHFIQYSAYNLLYLAASRAKYELIILGSELNGQSSCLKYALKNKNLIKMN